MEPNAAPLYVLVSKLNKRVAINTTIYWLEDVLNPSWATLNGATSAGSSNIVVHTGEGYYFNISDLVKVPSTGEIMYVTAASVSTAFSATRGYAGSTAASAADDSDLVIIGSAFEEGSAYSALSTVSTKTTSATNYLQIFRKAVEITKTMANVELYGGEDRPYQRKKKGIELMRDLERTFLFGKPYQTTSGVTHARRMCGGIESFISTNSTAAGGALTETEFDGFLRTVFRYGSSTRYLFCAPIVLSVISLWAQGKLNMFPKDRTYGIAISQYQSAHGTVNLVKELMLENAGGVSSTSYYGGYAFAIELEDLIYRYLQNRDVQMETDIQHPGDDYYKDQILGSCKRLLNRWISFFKKDNTEGRNSIIQHVTEVFPMKLKDAARLGMLIETEGYIQVLRPYKRKGENCLSSPHINVSITNTDMGLLSWAKIVLEKELGHEFKVYSVSNSDKIRTKQCYRLVISRFDDIQKILNITRGLMLGIKKTIADLICSFLNYRKTFEKPNGYVHNKTYSEVFNRLINKVDKIKQTYDQILPVTTLRSPDHNDQKIKSELISNDKRPIEISGQHVSA